MENYVLVIEQLNKMGLEHPSEVDVKRLAKIVLEEVYQVEIFRQELTKLKSMKLECARKAKDVIFEYHLERSRDQMIELVCDAISDEVEIPNLTHTVKYMVAPEF